MVVEGSRPGGRGLASAVLAPSAGRAVPVVAQPAAKAANTLAATAARHPRIIMPNTLT